LWKGGENYTIDRNIASPPLWWINGVGPNSLRPLPTISSDAAVSTAPRLFVPTEPVRMSVKVSPDPRVAAYAVEDRLPEGWAPAKISDNGEFDPVNRMVKWGPFYDAAGRNLSYEAVPPATARGGCRFEGTASFDGCNAPIGGGRQMQASCRMGKLQRCANGEFEMSVVGADGQPCAIEVSENLVDWKPLATVTNIGGLVRFADPDASVPQRFYRIVLQ